MDEIEKTLATPPPEAAKKEKNLRPMPNFVPFRKIKAKKELEHNPEYIAQVRAQRNGEVA